MGIIYKPGTRKGAVFLSDKEGPPPTITLPNGQVVTAVRGDKAGGTYFNEGNYQWAFPSSVAGFPNATLSFNGQQQQIGNTSMSWRGDSVGSLSQSDKVGGVGSSQVPAGYAPGQYGQYGFFPSYLGNQFPSPQMANYDPAALAKYNFTDPIKFGKKYGEFNRKEISKNFDLAQGLALKELDTELKGLQAFTPAAAALKRSETSIDNTFNQDQRTAQVNKVLPGARGQLDAQNQRAQTLASGRLPSSIDDRAYELGIRSASADNSASGGFGERSSVARKASDLMSASQRLQVSQYGDQLLSNNINQDANLFLAPTEYSNAGSQISVVPEVGAGRLTSSLLSETNALTTIPTSQGFQSQIQQEQFRTGQTQQNSQFNAGNALQASEFNAGTANQFALDKFQYQVGFAGTVAGAAQTDSNTQVAIDQQQKATDAANAAAAAAQHSDSHGIFGKIIGAALPIAGAAVAGYYSSGNPAAIAAGAQAGQTIASGFNSSGSAAAGSAAAGQQGAATSAGQTANSGASDSGVAAAGASVPRAAQLPATTNIQGAGPVPSPVSAPIADFRNATGASLPASLQADPNRAVTNALLTKATNTLNLSGMYYDQQPGSEPVGNNTGGTPIYADSRLVRSSDTSTGAQVASAIGQVIGSTGATTPEDAAAFSATAATAQDPTVINSLDEYAAKGDTKGFVNTALQAVGAGDISKASKDPEALGVAFSAHEISKSWPQMSPAQKSLALAGLGISAFKFSDSTGLHDKVVAKGGNPGDASLTAAQALSLHSQGYNVASLSKNWQQLNTLHKVASGDPKSSDSVAKISAQFNTLGSGLFGSAVPGVTASTLSAAGWRPAPQYGVGAMTAARSATIPKGYTTVTRSKDVQIVAPSHNLNSATGALGASSLAGTQGGHNGVSLSASRVYEKWGEPSKATQGVVGGNALQGSLAQLRVNNPYIAGAMVATNMFSGVSKGEATDKEVQNHFTQTGVISGNKVVTPSGMMSLVGQAPKGGMSDNEYAAAISGIALGRLVTGKLTPTVDSYGARVGVSVANADFTKTALNLRGIYAKAGIKSKGDAYQLANQAYAEGRIDENTLTSMHRSFDVVFNPNGKDALDALTTGRDRGMEIAKTQNTNPDRIVKRVPMGQGLGMNISYSKEQIRAMNQKRYSQPQGVAA